MLLSYVDTLAAIFCQTSERVRLDVVSSRLLSIGVGVDASCVQYTELPAIYSKPWLLD